MILFLECATITDNVDFISKIDLSRLNPIEASQIQQVAKIRKQIKIYSDMEFLIGKIKEGDNIIFKKVIFDKYLLSNVDTMKLLVKLNIQCPFLYNAVYGKTNIDASSMATKQQWAVQMIMQRYILSSIYHLGAYSALNTLFSNTQQSYNPKFKELPSFSQQLSIATSYLKEAYLPLSRFNGVFNWVEKLQTLASQQYMQVKSQVFNAHKTLVQCNLGYLLLQKLRLLRQFRKCKEGSKDICDKLYRVRQTLGGFPQTKQTILQFIDTGLIFFKIYTLVNLLKQNEIRKEEEDLGFVKKQFKIVVVQNLKVTQAIIGLCKELSAKAYETQFYQFASRISNTVFNKFAQQVQLVYSIKTQTAQNLYQSLEARSFEHIWETIPTYDLMSDI